MSEEIQSEDLNQPLPYIEKEKPKKKQPYIRDI